jgi:hypothetical protein
MCKLIRLSILSVALFGLPACASSWWAQFQADPAAEVAAFETSAQTALQLLQVAWSSLSFLLPPNVLATTQVTYNKAVAVAEAGLTALQDAVQTAVDAQTSNPSFSALIADVSNDIQAIEAIVDQFTSPSGDAGPSVAFRPSQVVGLNEAQAAILTMKRIGHVK